MGFWKALDEVFPGTRYQRCWVHKIANVLNKLPKSMQPAVSDTRLFLEAVLWIVRTDAPWRDLPPEFGTWNSTFRRFRRWVQADVFKRIFDALSDRPDMEYAMIDATIVKLHRHGMGAKGGLRARLSPTGRRLRSNLPRGENRKADGPLPGSRNGVSMRGDENPGFGGCACKPCALRSDACQPLRHRGRRAVDPGCRFCCDACRQGIRQQLDHPLSLIALQSTAGQWTI